MADSIEELLLHLPQFQGRETVIQPLEGGLTNRNYRVETEREAFVLRIAGADTALLGIDRDQEAACSRLAASAGVGPEVVAFLPHAPALVTRFIEGPLLADADARQPETLRRVAETLRRFHEHPTPPGLSIFSPFETVRSYHRLCYERNVPLPDDLDIALDRLARIEESLRPPAPLCLCHNDLLPNNFIDAGRQVFVIDWEYAGLGDRFFDLGNLAVNFQLTSADEEMLLADYFGEARPDDLRRLRLMRLASDMREAMWGYVQAGISRLYTPQYYLDYGRKHLDRFLHELANRA